LKILVGVGVLILRNQHVLLGKRKGSHGSSTWGLPGGHLEPGESVEDCAIRETLEETGLSIACSARAGFASDVFENEQKHYITLFVEAKDQGGDAKIMEPEKCETWQWFALNQLPEPLFAPLRSFLDQGYRA